MFCPKCGHQNDDSAAQCVSCGEPLRPPVAYPPASQLPATPPPPPQTPIYPQGGPAVPNYLVQAILATLFCCLPFGIVSIVYAAQVNGKLQGGDYRGALDSSKSAKLWAWIAFGVGLVVGVLYFVLVIVGAIAGAGHH